MSTGNAKHRAAVATTTGKILALRADVRTQLAIIGKLHGQLADLADTRQSVGLPFQTPAAREHADRQARLDRIAARTPNSVPPSGPVPAPVTMPAVAASAEILFTLRHHINRFTRALIGHFDAEAAFIPGPLTVADREQFADWHAAMSAYRVALEEWRATVRADRKAGRCTWPRLAAPTAPEEPAGRNPLVADPVTTDGDVDQLLHQLGRLVDHYTSRNGLQDLLRELEHLEDVARTVLDGVPATEPAPRPTCPWCGRDTLALVHRERRGDTGIQNTDLIRCVGNHPCRCDRDVCPCRRGRRHEWNRAAGAADTWTQLANLQNKHQELIAMETKALDAIARVRDLHQPEYDDGTPVIVHVTDTHVPDEHECNPSCYVDVDEADASETPWHAVLCCAACGDPLHVEMPEDYAGDGAVVGLPVFWPCPTIRALELDQPTPDNIHSTH